MKLQEKINDIIKNYDIINNDDDDFFPSNGDIENFFYELEQDGLIDFSVINREGNSDNWLQAEYYCNKLGYTVILDYDMQDSYSSIQSIIDDIERINQIIININNKIK
jgi:hypothetical protein